MNVLAIFQENIPILTVLLAVCVAAALFLSLYLLERRKTAVLLTRLHAATRFTGILGQDTRHARLLVRKTDLRVLYVSPEFPGMTGIEEEAVRSDIEALKSAVSPETARRLIRAFSDWTKEEPLEAEVAFGFPGMEKDRQGRVYIVADKVSGDYLCGLTDCTEEYRERLAMEAKLKQVYQESQAKSDFLSKMSHEIRTPMNGILGMLNLAQGHIDDAKRAGEYLVKAEDLSQFLLTLINDILDMSRIESGKLKLEEASFDIFAVADKLNSMFCNTVEAKGIHWIIEMQDFDVRYLIGDELRLTQVVVNFISNAQKFTPAGGTITVTFRQMSKIEGKLHLMIRVRDTGKGIHKDFIKNIFRPFEQEDASTARNYGGSGLGMAIADNIVRLMDGQIIVESELGKGTEFVVYIALPIAEVDQTLPDAPTVGAGSRKAQEAYEKAVSEFSLEGRRILLAEDNDINAEIAIEILGMDGAIVDHAPDGAEALRMFKESPLGWYDVILMDIQMPNMDGRQATREIRALSRSDADVLILAMSANAFIEDQRESIRVGMDGHISKPVDFDELRRTIAEHLCGDKKKDAPPARKGM